MPLASYGYFADVARRVQWDEQTVDLSADTAAWPSMGCHDRQRVFELVAGFCVAEWAVAGELGAFAAAIGDEEAAACFRAQETDEHRHSRFFDRVASEVLGVHGESRDERRAAVRNAVHPAFLELFEERLPARAAAVSDVGGIPEAVGLYHLVLEGTVLLAGQFAFFDVLDELGRLPGLRAGVGLVHRDERWHIGFGARCLQDLALPPGLVERIVAEGDAAVSVWGRTVGAKHTERMARLHRRRLRAAGLLHAATSSGTGSRAGRGART